MSPLHGFDRRDFLKSVGATAASTSALDEDEDGRLFEIVATERGELYYWFTVEGEVEKARASEKVEAESNDAIIRGADEDTRTVRGFTGNPGWGDAYLIDGELTSFGKVAGDADFYLRLDGEHLPLEVVPRPDHLDGGGDEKPNGAKPTKRGPEIEAVATGVRDCGDCAPFEAKSRFGSADGIFVVVAVSGLHEPGDARVTLDVQVVTNGADKRGKATVSYLYCDSEPKRVPLESPEEGHDSGKSEYEKSDSRIHDPEQSGGSDADEGASATIGLERGPIPAARLPGGKHEAVCTVTDRRSSQSATGTAAFEVADGGHG